MTPQRRLEGLVVKAVDDELLIYDLDSHRSHALSPLAAALWRRCDGRQTPSALAQALRVPEVAVTYGLGALSDARLLRTPAPWISRREALRWVGATTLPLVHSIIAPTAAQAQSVITPPGGGNGGGTPPPDLCLPPEFQCATTAQCCAGLDCQDGGFGVTVCLEPSVPSQSECLRLGDLCEHSDQCCAPPECVTRRDCVCKKGSGSPTAPRRCQFNQFATAGSQQRRRRR
jgi:hypothetical protein